MRSWPTRGRTGTTSFSSSWRCSALLTAFYTMRQILMTFFGKPRTAAAAHANEHDSIFTWMTIPLMVLAVFAVAVGWVGIPTTFPVLGNFSTNPLEHYIGGLAEALRIEVAELAFNPVPLATSLIVAWAVCWLGWLIYRKVRTPGVNLEQGEQLTAPEQFVDPLERPLGPVYRVLQEQVLLR